MKLMTVDLMQSILRTIIGEGTNKIYVSGQSQKYEKGDIMKYYNNGTYTLYICRIAGDYALPSEQNFKKINLGNFK